jgi:DNA repair exonuclease SbcCD nuclease subunit
MRFLHTADWQIGMKAAVLGDAGARVREERLAAGRRVVETAKSHDVDFLLVAGDLFEDNAVDRVLVQKVADILNSFGGPVFVIPGNHDPLVPGSVCRKIFGVRLGILRFGVIHKKVGHDFPGETFHVLKEKEEK